MSHRKFEHPRCGSLGFLPRKRCRHNRGAIRAWPADDASQAPHLCGFMGYKAGMTHIVRDARPGSKMAKKEIVEPVTIIETPPMVIVGVTGYQETIHGLRCLGTVFAETLDNAFRRAYYKNWYKTKKKAFKKYAAKLKESKKYYDKDLARLKKYASAIRAVAHTQPRKVHIHQKKAHIMEIQINGGEIGAKVDFCTGLFEKEVKVDAVFKHSEVIDTIAVTRGHGFEGVVHRWGVTRLPRKTHKGLRKVACIGPWHPSRVGYTVPRAGQNGFHHRTEINKKIYRIGKNLEEDPHNAKCDPTDMTEKPITPMGGFPHYGIVREDFLMIKGTCPGPVRRIITLRKPIIVPTSRAAQEEITLKFIDTSSKWGHGKFQTADEKAKFMGPTKRSVAKKDA